MLRYWNRLIHMDNSRLCKTVFLWDYNICTNNLSAEIKYIMSKIGTTRWFEQLEVCDTKNVNKL